MIRAMSEGTSRTRALVVYITAADRLVTAFVAANSEAKVREYDVECSLMY